MRASEISGMTSNNDKVLFDAFYGTLRDVNEYYTSHPETNVLSTTLEEAVPMLETPDDELVTFTGEEMWGQTLDLHALFEEYCNLPAQFQRVDYAQYLELFDKFHFIPSSKKRRDAKYLSYLDAVHAYLAAFYAKTHALSEIPTLESRLRAVFDERWKAKEVQGWTQADISGIAAGGKAGAAGAGGDDKASILVEIWMRWASAKTPADLEAFGGDALKHELGRLGLKCGGTVTQRAERLMLTKGVPLSTLPAKEFAKGSGGGGGGKGGAGKGGGKGAAGGGGGGAGAAVAQTPEEEAVHIAWKEERIAQLSELLSQQIKATIAQVEKKQSRTFEELEAERELARDGDDPAAAVENIPDSDSDDDDDDDDKPSYNPLNLPLGFDGKPIPYWLYKLHGLGVEFKCEICGNFSYFGPKAYDRHFQEWRHAHGMRCLNIPNSRHFHGITLIEDALELYKKLKSRTGTETFKPDNEMEFEDSAGNVYNKKTYEDLLKQGLLSEA
jgi:splicing factor 3A subunit 3